MKRKANLLFLVTLAFVIAVISYAPSSSGEAAGMLFTPPPIIFAVDRTDDAAAAMACTAAANDCSLRGAIRKSNANVGADEVIIDLQEIGRAHV